MIDGKAFDGVMRLAIFGLICLVVLMTAGIVGVSIGAGYLIHWFAS